MRIPFLPGTSLCRCDGDVNGMAHSLEIRVPLLDQRVADLAYGLPGAVRLPSGKADKHLLLGCVRRSASARN